jgi:hypothetical protein
MLEFLEQWRKKAGFWLLVSISVFLISTLIGGAFFNLEGATIFSWFTTVLLIYFVFMFVVAVFAFIGWYLFGLPTLILPTLLIGIVLLLLVVKFVVSPDATPITDLGEIFKPILESFNM